MTIFLCWFAFSVIGCVNPTTTVAENQSSEVIIIGGGASGMATAKRLLELNISPIIIEREDRLGGAGIHAGRFFVVDTPWQIQSGIIDSVEKAIDEWPDFSGGVAGESIQQFLHESSQTLSWMEENGASFSSVQKDIGAGSTPRIHKLSDDIDHPLVQWQAELLQYSVLNTEITDIEYNQGGFMLQSSDGRQFQSNFVVVASGGFARNVDLVEESIPALRNIDWSMEAWPGMTGSGVLLLRSLNIQPSTLNQLGLYAHSVRDPILGFPEVMIVPALHRGLIVTSDGSRPFNEELTQSIQSGQLYLQHGPLFAIFDSSLWRGTTFQGLGYNYETPELLTAEEYQQLTNLPEFESIDHIADYLQIPLFQISDTIQEYNDGIANTSDQFNKDTSMLSPIQTPPFYIVPLTVTSAKSFGGALTDSNGLISTRSRLYAVGEAACFLGTSEVGWGFSGSITSCYTQGKSAAEHISQAIHSSALQ